MVKKADGALPNELLTYEREHHHWTQEEVAQMIEVPDPKMIGRWERGITQPSPHYRRQLAALFGKSTRELGFVRKDEIPFWSIPSRRNLFFTGRDALLARIHSSLTTHKSTTLLPPQALSGLGGIGKTQTALEYAYRYAHEYHTVAWIRADSPDTLASDFTALADLLGLPERTMQEQNHIINAVQQWLSVMTRWLLIFDNANTLDILQEILPATCPGHILITTQSHIAGTLAQTIEVDAMTVDEGAYFLLRRAKRIDLHTPLHEAAATDLQHARTLSQALGGVPLALDQAGAYIEETACGLANYLKIYQRRHKELLQRRGITDADHPPPVTTTWSLSFEKVQQTSPTAASLLHLLAFATADAIPEECITQGAAALGPQLAPVIADQLNFDTAIKVLRHFSLLRRNSDISMLNIHALVQTVLRNTMDEHTQRQWSERWVRALCLIFPTGEFGTYQQCERLLSQGIACAELIRSWQMVFLEAAQLLRTIGKYQKGRGRYKQALTLFQQALTILKELQPTQHVETVRCLREMGDIFEVEGLYNRAETLFQQAITLCEEQLDPSHIEIALTLYKWAEVCILQTHYSQGLAISQRALALCELQADAQYRSLQAEILNNMAYVFLRQKDYRQAAGIFQQAMLIHKQILDPFHPNMAIHYNNIAFCHFEQGNYSDAESFYLQAIAIWEQAFGPEHPDVAHGLANLARLNAARGNYAQAEQDYQRSLTIISAALETADVKRVMPLRGLARLHAMQQHYQQAEQYYQQIVHILEHVPEPQYPKLLEVLDEMLQLAREQDKSQRVEHLQQHMQEIRSLMSASNTAVLIS